MMQDFLFQIILVIKRNFFYDIFRLQIFIKLIDCYDNIIEIACFLVVNYLKIFFISFSDTCFKLISVVSSSQITKL